MRIQSSAGDGLKLELVGTVSRTYTIVLELDTATGAKRFSHEFVSLEANSSHIIQPDWLHITTANLKILIDHNNDGTIDDSMVVENQITDVRSPGSGRLPSAFVLHQNYPNPFNPRTKITYDIPKRADVRVKIYDVFGREVAILVDGVQEPGQKSVEWNAPSFASGVYFCKLEADNVILTRKLVLLK